MFGDSKMFSEIGGLTGTRYLYQICYLLPKLKSAFEGRIMLKKNKKSSLKIFLFIPKNSLGFLIGKHPLLVLPKTDRAATYVHL